MGAVPFNIVWVARGYSEKIRVGGGGRCQEKNKTKKQYRGGGLVELKKMLMDENQVRK